jgi:hypothetical protein
MFVCKDALSILLSFMHPEQISLINESEKVDDGTDELF